jgi:hypothetical protein
MWGSPTESGASTRGYAVRRPSQPISRVLSPQPQVETSAEGRGAIIYLGRRLPAASSGLPGTRTGRTAPLSLLGLAPSGGYLAARVTTSAGGLLHHLFTLTRRQRPVSDIYLLAVYFSVALFRRVTHLWMLRIIDAPHPRVRPRLGVTQHRALWSPDFPQPMLRIGPMRSIGRDRLADLGVNAMIAHGQRLSRIDPNPMGYSSGL